jgi:hypothetical protein
LIERERPVFFHTETEESFARVKVQGHLENLPIQSAEFSSWLKRLLWKATKEAVDGKTLDAVRGVLEGKARFEGQEHRLYNRVAWHDGAIWYDLGDSEWRAVKVTPQGWSLVTDVPILFRRYAHQRPQLVPDRAGALSEAERFLNLRTDTDADGHTVYDERYLFLVALISYLVPDIPHPIIVLYGEHGAAKTTLSRIARELVDPSAMPTLGEPKRDEVGQLLQHHYLLPFDNLSFLHGWLSDTLCRAVTGDGLTKRRLYTDEGDVIFAYRRCILLNGINTVASRPDLLDRSILLECQPIPDGQRKPERILWRDFEAVKARILGGIFNALCEAMRVKPGLKLDGLPRMADFAEWGRAIGEACGWGQKAFLDAYTREAASRNGAALDSSPVAQAIISLMEHESAREEPAAQLLSTLRHEAERLGIDTHGRGWPRDAHGLSLRLNQVIPNLRHLGIRVTHGWRGKQKLIVIRSEGTQNCDGSDGSVGCEGNETT